MWPPQLIRQGFIKHCIRVTMTLFVRFAHKKASWAIGHEIFWVEITTHVSFVAMREICPFLRHGVSNMPGCCIDSQMPLNLKIPLHCIWTTSWDLPSEQLEDVFKVFSELSCHKVPPWCFLATSTPPGSQPHQPQQPKIFQVVVACPFFSMRVNQ